MRRAAAVLGALAMVIGSANLMAQAKPSFAGTWTLQQPEGGGGGGGGRGGGRGGGGFGGGAFACGQQCTIAQDANTLTVTRTMGENTVSAKYMLDGSESSNTSMGRGGEVTVVSKAVWEGNNLVITTTLPNGGEAKATLSMADGMMTVSTTRPGRGGGDPVTTTQSYKKG